MIRYVDARPRPVEPAPALQWSTQACTVVCSQCGCRFDVLCPCKARAARVVLYEAACAIGAGL